MKTKEKYLEQGKRLRELRLARRSEVTGKPLTAVELSSKLHISAYAIYNYELGRTVPITNILKKLTDFFGEDNIRNIGWPSGSETFIMFNQRQPKAAGEDSFATALKEVRLKLGLKQHELAKILDMTEQRVGKIERGALKPDPYIVEKLEELYGQGTVERLKIQLPKQLIKISNNR